MKVTRIDIGFFLLYVGAALAADSPPWAIVIGAGAWFICSALGEAFYERRQRRRWGRTVSR